MIKLFWLITTIAAQGPVNARIQDEVQFNTMAECHEYAARMAPRMQDWVRGALQAGWSHPVQAAAKCDEGEPA